MDWLTKVRILARRLYRKSFGYDLDRMQKSDILREIDASISQGKRFSDFIAFIFSLAFCMVAIKYLFAYSQNNDLLRGVYYFVIIHIFLVALALNFFIARVILLFFYLDLSQNSKIAKKFSFFYSFALTVMTNYVIFNIVAKLSSINPLISSPK